MTSVTLGHGSNWSPGIGIREHLGRANISRVSYSEYCRPFVPSRETTITTPHGNRLAYCRRRRSGRRHRPVFAGGSVDGAADPDDSDAGLNESDSPEAENREFQMNFDMLRENLERSVGTDDSRFSGIDLATLIRNKYGRSYDVQLIKKEFMGRNLLALNVMWKYREQKSFPLSEEEYLLRLDGVANTLKCWGAVAHIRNSLHKTKDRPRIGKAVSIFIDMDESGGRAKEWIYK
ncbi:uncharacterized protein LOC111022311 [Momordica charantia]|uniref:Uncharacterized protein LOC111022311 n=1 Tax=Momordica charantia TaxID=3673 RepID=A0A6J1DNM9_MOMCH|nr:uncharacterized protein LOC111022311 [Momordica charantia]